MTSEDVLREIWLCVSRMEGYVEGSTKGLIARLEGIESLLEEIVKRKKK